VIHTNGKRQCSQPFGPAIAVLMFVTTVRLPPQRSLEFKVTSLNM
jgi:hypothetical protein